MEENYKIIAEKIYPYKDITYKYYKVDEDFESLIPNHSTLVQVLWDKYGKKLESLIRDSDIKKVTLEFNL